uniref:Ribonuclease H-like domain-containing protein n=1 Tax=Tanacetum cinerariifolium TaxID=118510 RepID=A0A6L2K603_TANCI|nr:ribonuclease H-like domain-containing protein [Tanacetum cinerariifolium]
MKHYLENTDYPIWEVIQKGNGHVQVSADTHGQIRVLPPKTTEEILARERERKARTTLLMAIPEDHLAIFHKMTDAKEIWEAIKSRFCGNDESKKMQKYLMKQQFKSFLVSNSEGLHKGYDRFQNLLSQLETHGAGVSTEDANQKFLRVFESDVKGSTRSSSSSQNVAFVSSENTSSTNEVNIAYDGSTSSGHNSQKECLHHTLMISCTPSLLINPVVAMISTRLKKFYKKIGRKLHFDAKEHVGFDKSKVKCFNYHNIRHFTRERRSKGNQDSRRRDAVNTRYKARNNGKRPAKQDKHKAMVTVDGEGVDWTGHAKDKTEDYALMAYNSSNSGSDTKMSAKDKYGLGYESQIYDGVLTYENEVFTSVFDRRSSDVEDSLVNDRFAKVKEMHASTTSESNAKTGDLDSCDSNSSIETLEYVPKPVKNEPKAVSEPKVWSDAPIIEEYESDSDDEHNTKPNNRDWDGLMSKRLGLGYGFTKKACFVCGSFSHLIRDCDFHEKRMAKQIELNKETKGEQGLPCKSAKPRPKLDDSVGLDVDSVEYMETEEAVDEGRTSNKTAKLNLDADTKVIAEEKGSGEKGESIISTARPKRISTARPKRVSTADVTISTANPEMKKEKAKEKGVAFKEVKELDRPARSVLTLKPLPTIDPKNKGKAILEEPEPKKMTRSDFDAAQVARDEEIAKQLEAKLHEEVERERQIEEQASIDYITNLYDEVQARIDADHELAVKVTHEEQEKYIVDERAKLLAEYFKRRKKQLAEEKAAAIRNKPPTRT